jgi:pilus assembly protein Flp/PilA
LTANAEFHGGARSTKMKNLIARFMKDESGATAIEYGLIAALISVGIITAVSTVGNNLETTFNSISNGLTQ